MKIVKASEDTISIVVDMKMRMSKELGIDSVFGENVEEKIKETYLNLYHEDKGCHFLLYENNQVVAIGGAVIKDDIPFCFFKTPYYGFVIDIYCIPSERRKGYAKKIMETVLEWLKEKGVHMVKLKPSKNGKELYEKLGFHNTNEMEKFI